MGSARTAARPVLAMMVALCGCASLAGNAAKTAVTGSLEAVNEPRNRQAAETFMSSAEVHEGVRQLAMGATDGVISGLAQRAQSPQSQAELDNLTAEIAASFDRSMTPRIQGWTAAAVRSALDETTNAETRAALSGMTRAIVRSMQQEFARGIREELTPALREALQGELRGVLVEASQDIAHGAAQGMGQALAEQQQRNPQGVSATLQSFLRLSRLGVVLLLVGVLLLFWTLRQRARRKHPPVVQPAVVSSEALRPMVVQALHELMSDPVAAQTIARELHRADSSPPH